MFPRVLTFNFLPYENPLCSSLCGVENELVNSFESEEIPENIGDQFVDNLERDVDLDADVIAESQRYYPCADCIMHPSIELPLINSSYIKIEERISGSEMKVVKHELLDKLQRYIYDQNSGLSQIRIWLCTLIRSSISIFLGVSQYAVHGAPDISSALKLHYSRPIVILKWYLPFL